MPTSRPTPAIVGTILTALARKPTFRAPLPAGNLALDTVSSKLDAIPFLDGRLIEHEVSATTVTIPHKLGRAYCGFLVLNGVRATEVESNTERDKILQLDLSAPAGQELISRYTFASNSTSATMFTGLDGNTDEVWTYRFKIVGNSNTTTWLYLNPNGSTGNGMGTWHYTNASATLHGSAGVGTEMGLMRSDGYLVSGYNICGEGTFFAAASFGRRQSLCRANDFNSNTSTGYYGGAGSGTWHNTTDNITSLGITAATASFIGTGSWFELYRNVDATLPRVVKLWVF